MLRALWGPAAQVSLVIALGLVLAFGAAAALTLAKFSEALSGAIEARYRIHAADLRATIETGINLGLDLAQIGGNLDVVVRSRLALDEGIARIIVTTAGGVEVFAMDRAGAGLAPLPAEAVLSQRGLAVENSFGAIVGEVTVVFASGVNAATLHDAAMTLLRDVAVLAAASAALSTLACILIMAPLPAALRAAQDLLDGAALAAAGPDPAVPPVTGAPGAEGGLHGLAGAAAAASRAALVEIARIDAALAADAGLPAPSAAEAGTDAGTGPAGAAVRGGR